MILLIIILVMLLAIIGIFVSKKRIPKHPKAVNTMTAFIIVLLVDVGFILYYTGVIGNIRETKLKKREYSYSATRAFMIDKFLKTQPELKKKPVKALIYTLKGYENNPRLFDLVKALEELFEPAIKCTIAPISLPDEKMHHYDQMEASHFDKIMTKHNDCDIIISTIGLPEDVENMDLWRIDCEKAPISIILDGSLKDISKYVENDQIQMLIINRLDAEITAKPIPDDPETAFNERYLIVTPENIKQIKNKFKQLF